MRGCRSRPLRARSTRPRLADSSGSGSRLAVPGGTALRPWSSRLVAAAWVTPSRPSCSRERLAPSPKIPCIEMDERVDVELTERQRQILRHVVEEYIESGQPVGSKNLVTRAGIAD